MCLFVVISIALYNESNNMIVVSLLIGSLRAEKDNRMRFFSRHVFDSKKPKLEASAGSADAW